MLARRKGRLEASISIPEAMHSNDMVVGCSSEKLPGHTLVVSLSHLKYQMMRHPIDVLSIQIIKGSCGDTRINPYTWNHPLQALPREFGYCTYLSYAGTARLAVFKLQIMKRPVDSQHVALLTQILRT